jgi:DNA-binding XRE family transcriptional regulator
MARMNKALKVARKKAGLSKTQLEQAASLRTGTIYDLENRRGTPAYDAGVRILRVLQALGVDQKTLDRIFPVKEKTTGSHAAQSRRARTERPLNGVEKGLRV